MIEGIFPGTFLHFLLPSIIGAFFISLTEGSHSTGEQSCFASNGTISAGGVPACNAVSNGTLQLEGQR